MPRGVTILPDETFLGVEIYQPPTHDKPLSTLKAMMGLTAVSHSLDIGESGPSNASNALEVEGEKHETQGKYDVFFPRDAHVVAGILGEWYPKLLRSTVVASFEKMGVKDNYTHPVAPYDEQEIGKIPHEIRDADDPIAQELTENKNWGWPYYGAVDTTGKNIISLTRYIEESDEGLEFLKTEYVGLDEKSHTIKEGLDANIQWLLRRMSLNPEGLIESLSKNPKHHPNQTWADSPEAFHHKDGTWPNHQPDKNRGVAAVEQQAEAYQALKHASALYDRLGDVKTAQLLSDRAKTLRSVVLDTFWVEDDSKHGGYFAQGTDRDDDGNLRPLETMSSDMGLLLDREILEDDPDDQVLTSEIRRKRTAVMKNLLSDEMLSPSGIRTKSTSSVRYGDDRYHGGASWPWVTYITARGFGKFDDYKSAKLLKDLVLESYIDSKLLGEYYSGSNDEKRRIIVEKVKVKNPSIIFEPVYAVGQPAQEVQAWTTAAVLAIKKENNPFKKL